MPTGLRCAVPAGLATFHAPPATPVGRLDRRLQPLLDQPQHVAIGPWLASGNRDKEAKFNTKIAKNAERTKKGFLDASRRRPSCFARSASFYLPCFFAISAFFAIFVLNPASAAISAKLPKARRALGAPPLARARSYAWRRMSGPPLLSPGQASGRSGRHLSQGFDTARYRDGAGQVSNYGLAAAVKQWSGAPPMSVSAISRDCRRKFARRSVYTVRSMPRSPASCAGGGCDGYSRGLQSMNNQWPKA